MSDRVEVVETSWTPGLPTERSQRLLQLLFTRSGEREDAASGETNPEERSEE
jgi:hypothetical protein